jgi:hypothetical protein
MTRASWYLLVGLAFAVHNGEEALVAGTMLELLQQQSPAFLRDLYAGVTVRELQADLLILSVAGLVLSAVARRDPAKPAAAFSMLVFAAVLGLNAIAHISLSVATQAPIPGIVTSVAITLPVAVLLFRQARREKWVSATAFLAIVPAALLVHGPLLAAFIWISTGAMQVGRP